MIRRATHIEDRGDGAARADGALLGIYRCRPVGVRRSGDHRGHGVWRDDAGFSCSRKVDRFFGGIDRGSGGFC